MTMRRLLPPLIFGLAGMAMLISLGVWQLQRLYWKQAILADIDARITSSPIAIPAKLDPVEHRYLPVIATGTFSDAYIRILASRKRIGAGYRIISPMQLAGRVILVDRGFVELDVDVPPRPEVPVTITGNLHWPDEVDGYTPDPDMAKNIWFARDVETMAEALKSDPVLLVVRGSDPAAAAFSPMPVDSKGIPNDHLQYAMTWFSLAVIWLCMTAYFIIRLKPKTES